MKYHLVAYGKLPLKLRINGLSFSCKLNNPAILYGPRILDGLEYQVWGYDFSRYGEYPRITELSEYGPWLAKTAPFFIEIEISEIIRINKIGNVLPKLIIIGDRVFTRSFDRYFIASELKQNEIEFIFDYMAPSYNDDITYKMNLDINRNLLTKIIKKTNKSYIKILDFGVGTGVCSNAIPKKMEGRNESEIYIIGLDISKLMVKEAMKVLYKEDINEYSILKEVHQIRDNKATFLQDGYFDAAMSCFTNQYFLDLQPYKEIYRLLKNGAIYVCNVFRNEIDKVEKETRKAGFDSLKELRHETKYIVRKQPIYILTFIKQSECEL